MRVTMHDGSVVRFRAVGEDYDPTSRDAAYAHIRRLQGQGEVVTGLLYIDQSDRNARGKRTIDDRCELRYEDLGRERRVGSVAREFASSARERLVLPLPEPRCRSPAAS